MTVRSGLPVALAAVLSSWPWSVATFEMEGFRPIGAGAFLFVVFCGIEETRRMGKKKRKDGIDEPKIAKVYCYYCERIFEDEKVLIMHQKSRHFKCNFCNKKLSTASGMVVHVAQVHKETILTVPNAKPGRDSVEVEVYGMEGVPGYSKVDNDPNKRARLETPTMFPRPPVAAYPMPMHYPVAPPVVMGPPRGPPMGFPMRPPPPPPHLLMRGPPPMMMPPHMAFPPGVVPPHMMVPPPLAATAVTSAYVAIMLHALSLTMHG